LQIKFLLKGNVSQELNFIYIFHGVIALCILQTNTAAPKRLPANLHVS